ncbi:DUF6801 domain-containing protein [Streptomyces sp. NPDC058326]|uniref:DUF6801 domain-containing protein n=1 Tax=Streptomyces sp. NPDC058326 TaxID=3346447 RepID=UPI0036E8DC35
MRGQRAALRPSRVQARGAAIAALVALAPLLPAAAVALGSHDIDAELPYRCTLPSGEQPATVRIRATVPDRAAVGEAVQPSDVSTTVELPAAAVADLTPTETATVRAETLLTVAASQNGQRADVGWRGTAQPVPVPAEGPLSLTTTGAVPALTTDSVGELTLTAGALSIDLALGAADGAATTPPSAAVTCVPGEGPEGGHALATVPIGAGATGEPSAPPASSADPSSSSPPAPSPSSGPPLPSPPTDRETPQGGPRPAPKDPEAGPRPERGPRTADADAPDAAPTERPAAPPCVKKEPTSTSLTAYITGYANVGKLKGASLIPASCVLIEQGSPEIVFPPEGPPHFLQTSDAALDHQGRKQTPPFTSTFLTFDFMPATATMVLEQAGPMTVSSDMTLSFPDNTAETYVRAPLVLRVLDVRVNGTPLDVGPSCRTEKPLRSPEPDPATYPGDHLVLLGKGQLINGSDAVGYLLTSGGPLTGEVTIPAFKNCGAGGENLDRLLTASISGPGNHVKQIQGQTCAVMVEVPTEGQCTEDRQPYVVPKPER